ncbi:hypothetical protein BHM03_00024637 [Ensete ventricosum]|nr:hypothetical protein BHM03_00024637 [Ensete ventricosum]
MTTNGAGLDTDRENPWSVIILQKRFGVGPNVVTSSAWGGWFGSVRCSAFESPDGRSAPCRSFYTGRYRSSVPEIFNAPIAYHAVVLLHIVHGPRNVVRILHAAAVAGRPYLCQVSRTIANSSMLASSRLRCVGSAMLET